MNIKEKCKIYCDDTDLRFELERIAVKYNSNISLEDHERWFKNMFESRKDYNIETSPFHNEKNNESK